MQLYFFALVFTSLSAWTITPTVLASGIGDSLGKIDAMPDHAPATPQNPITPEKAELGKLLFFDPRISRTEKVSCNSCHNVFTNGSDGKSVAIGVEGKTGTRHAPTVFNALFNSVQLWDGRAPSLEAQAKGPLINPVEMGMPDHQAVVDRLAKIPGYQKLFKNVFGDQQFITIEHFAEAVATYERTLITPDSAYDLFARGDIHALSPAAQRGMVLTRTIGCTACHSGPNFAGPSLPVGTGFFMRFPTFRGSEYELEYHLADDLGRFNATRKKDDKNMWKVQSWRNVAIRGPYFHNGSVPSLEEAVRVMARTQLNKILIESQVKDIVAFLESLTGKVPTQTVPTLPEEEDAFAELKKDSAPAHDLENKSENKPDLGNKKTPTPMMPDGG
jgi:cytochrome c peroxidase